MHGSRTAGLAVWAVILTVGSAHAQKDRTADLEAPSEADTAAVAEEASIAGARQFLTDTMALVEKAKWKEFKARIHPFAIKAMEERKKRTKRDDHNLAFWTHVKEWKIEKWEITSVEPGARGTAVVTTREDLFMIEEKGHEEGKDAEWLLLKTSVDGKPAAWWILDRRNQTGNFTSTTIEKGFADVLPPPTDDGAEPGKAATPVSAYQKKLEMAVRKKFNVPEEIPANQLKVMKCTVKIMIDEGGGITSRSVSRASGNPTFDSAILRAVDASDPLPAPDNPVVAAARDGIEVTFKGKP
jgi:TonB family protein